MNARTLTDFSTLTGRLEAVDVVVALPGKTLLQGVSAQFSAGQVTAILGPNGAGKSTLMAVLSGQRQPSSGEVCLAGQTLAAHTLADLARVRACVAQETQVAFEFTVREVVELGRYPHRRQPSRHEAAIVLQAMQATQVDHLAERALNTLSGGEKARAHLARALAQVWDNVGDHSARWLLLDEPTAALDLQHQHRMLQLARDWACEQGVGVVAVLHDLNLALRYSERCVVLQGGQVVASGLTPKVLTPACIAKVWGVHAQAVPALGGLAHRLQYVFEPV
ncbi:heme ABC transporter ATP-binding protein [Polaromonas sp. UC242_47]|uniref:heme ABC transporter ATP-binding protein n=1 Tax=Polaromonas sp. UC242_47 TaxID=3374626 RepID=UPI0037B18AF5